MTDSITVSAARIQYFRRAVLSWYDRYGRKDLPWQHNKTAYRVWLSEIMLQQTQVATVIPYFNKFIAQFPNIKALAQTDEDTVLHLWAGLGYYSRARNLHKTAKIITEQFAGEFPNELMALQQLPGIGRSTAGAIIALAFDQAAAILDGNVKRLLVRFNAIEQPINDRNTEKQLWQLAERLLSQKRLTDYTQVLMDLGAMVCTRCKPICHQCPLLKQCLAFQTNSQDTLPRKVTTKKIPTKKTAMLLLQNQQGEILLEKRPPTGIWGGLWSLPECDQDVANFCRQQFGLSVGSAQELPPFRHSFSHFRLQVTPILVEVQSSILPAMDSKMMTWYHPGKQQRIGLPQPIAKLLADIVE